MNRLVLIDGNAVLHRAFHALPPLTDQQGNLVNAVYGFASMLLKIANDFQPTHLAVAFDRPAPTFRKKIFLDYQAKRPKMDDNLIPQVDKVHRMLEAFKIPIYEKDGFEADDIIGTITKNVKIDQIIIMTGDRDILQLVENDKVLVYMPTKGLSEGKLYGEKEVIERMGVKPVQIPDFKALAGDSSDNYPGVPGIGPKTAIMLLNKYNSLKTVYQKQTKLPISAKLKAGRESAFLSQALATIKTDVSLEINIQDLVFTGLDVPQAKETLEKYGFKSLVKRLDKNKLQPEKFNHQPSLF